MTRSLRLLVLVLLLGGAAVTVKSTDRGTLDSLGSRVWSWVSGEASGDAGMTWCPMDPQIVLKGPGMCPICNMELVPYDKDQQPEPGVLVLSDRQIQQAGVRLGRAEVRDLVREIDATGRLEVNPAKRTTVVMPFPGESIVDEIHVHAAGTYLNEGQVIMEVQNGELMRLLVAYREVLAEFAEHRRNREEDEAQDALERMNALAKTAASWGLVGSNLNFFASSPKFQFSAPSFPVYSPVDGTILAEPGIFVGGRVPKGAKLFDVAELWELWLYVDLYEHERPFVAVNQSVEFTTLAVPNEVFQSTIRFIEPIVQSGTQTIRAQARVPNRNGKLAPGMFVRARIAAPVTGALSVPESAVLQSGRRNVVIVSEGDGRFRPRIVELGRQHLFLAQADEDADSAFGPDDERYHEILDGLHEGERVVMAGNFLLNAEAQFQGILKKMVEDREAQENALDLEADAAAAMESVLSAYFDLSQALIDDDPSRLVELGQGLADAAGGIEGDDAAGRMFTSLRDEGLAFARLGESGDPDWDGLRTRFGSISREVVGYLRDYAPARVNEGELTLFRCPMADDFGFDLWIQESNEIANPYMGQMMLECGTTATLE